MADQPRTPLPYDEDELNVIAESILDKNYSYNDFVGALRIELLNRIHAIRQKAHEQLDETNARMDALTKDLGL